MLTPEIVDLFRLLSLYAIAFFVIGYLSSVLANLGTVMLSTSIRLSQPVCYYFAALFSALSLIICVEVVMWLGQLMAAPFSFAMLILPTFYLIYYYWPGLRGGMEPEIEEKLRFRGAQAVGVVIGLASGGLLLALREAPLF